MTKRSIKSDIDELSEELLDDIDQRERFALLMIAAEKGNHQWSERLLEDRPAVEYRGLDPEFIRVSYMLLAMAERTVYELHVALLEYQLLEHERSSNLVEASYTGTVEETSDLSSLSAGEETPAEILAKLNVEYRARKRFAEEFLGIDLETWVTDHPSGPGVVAAVSESLADSQEILEDVRENFPTVANDQVDLTKEGMPDELSEDPFDRLVLLRYTELVDSFEANSLENTRF